MTSATTVPLAEVKARLSELVRRVAAQHERVTVTVHGRPSAVLVAIDDLASLEETISVLTDSQAMASLAESEDEIARGDLVSQAELSAAMAARRQAGR